MACRHLPSGDGGERRPAAPQAERRQHVAFDHGKYATAVRSTASLALVVAGRAARRARVACE